MKIQNKLTLISSLVFGIVFSIASFSVYFIFYNSSRKIVFDELERYSKLAAFFYLEEDELPKSEHREIAIQFQKIIEQNTEVRVFDKENTIRYGSEFPDEAISEKILSKTRKDGSIRFRKKDDYYSGIFYHDNQGDFVVIIKETRSNLRSQLNLLLFILFIVLLIGLVAIILISRAMSKLAYQPVRNLIDEVKLLEINSIDNSLTPPATKDEIEELVQTFNDLLKRLSDSIIIQKNFINYVSHEFKTPLASISGNLEVFASKNRTQEEQEQVSIQIIENVHQINNIIHTLMELSGLRKDEKTFLHFRIDEKLWKILDKHPANERNQIEISLDIPPQRVDLLTVFGNPLQLEMALNNLIENALKYSENQPVHIVFSEREGKLLLTISDKGKGIPIQDLEYIQKPFFRASNTQDVAGSGIGLSIASIIFKQHKIEFSIQSEEGKGTNIFLLF
jgi:two-component system, OmpR family, sensor histidine kinase ArlS